MSHPPASPRVGTTLRAATRAAPVAAAVLIVVGLIYFGRLAQQHLAAGARYRIPLANIDCNPPPGADRTVFLGEVQYLARLPDELNLLEAGLAGRLALAFGRHPWVEEVERVEVTPARQVQVRLRFRTPVLAVPVAGAHQMFAVDRHGIRLPGAAPTAGLPIFPGKAAPPAGPAGTAWGDRAVETAASEAGGPRPD